MEGGAVGHILKGDHPRTIPAKFALIWFRGFRGEDLNVIFYQNMSNLYNQYKSIERKISRKNPEYMGFFCNLFIFPRTDLYIHDSINTMFQCTKVTM